MHFLRKRLILQYFTELQSQILNLRTIMRVRFTFHKFTHAMYLQKMVII